MIDLYCERMADGLWAEPLNAVTNLAFLLAAGLSVRLARWHRQLDAAAIMLIGLMLLIGIGSTLFHILASGWAKLADELPILLFQLVYLWLYCRELIGLQRAVSALLLLGYLGVSLAAAQLTGLNGSLGYVPALLVLLGLAIYHLRLGQRESTLLLQACGWFLLSLTLRTLDMALCAYWPLGSHFGWHLLNGLVLYLVFRAWLLNRPVG
ncbi:ceramidase domain-containing protein [Marinobacterium arenosum]|uniref:ceramidase domain-containing protein n=1 Tax=Marinobacterium arenosum TaxID=2862496 RepID=UPI001C94AA3D|nr:ceramidase domain-containing protein [Marinobacterium arenosum]MBY4676947.1 ceramidase [Marinobacterium arenosum]